MRWSRWIWLALPGAALVLACAEDPGTGPGVHSLSGRVRLTGFLVDSNGQVVGTRVVNDADGVAVELLYGSQVLATTTTMDGGYTFTGLAPGGYKTRSSVIGPVGDQTSELTITQGDLIAGDTLKLVSAGDLFPIPNPNLVLHSTMIWFALAETVRVDVRIRDVAGGTVVPLIDGVRPMGLNLVIWDGLDAQGAAAADPLYWVTLEAGIDTRAHLLFR